MPGPAMEVDAHFGSYEQPTLPARVIRTSINR
jgi:hypothetical protein